MRLSGKTIVVAGGTGGIGSEVARGVVSEVARGVVSEGGNVLLVARDPGELAERVAKPHAIAATFLSLIPDGAPSATPSSVAAHVLLPAGGR